MDDNLLSLTVGEDSYARGLLAGSAAVAGGDLLFGLDYSGTDGPWDLEEDLRRVNALVKYSQGERRDGYAITASVYDGSWNSTDQIPERAVDFRVARPLRLHRSAATAANRIATRCLSTLRSRWATGI